MCTFIFKLESELGMPRQDVYTAQKQKAPVTQMSSTSPKSKLIMPAPHSQFLPIAILPFHVPSPFDLFSHPRVHSELPDLELKACFLNL